MRIRNTAGINIIFCCMEEVSIERFIFQWERLSSQDPDSGSRRPLNPDPKHWCCSAARHLRQIILFFSPLSEAAV